MFWEGEKKSNKRMNKVTSKVLTVIWKWSHVADCIPIFVSVMCIVVWCHILTRLLCGSTAFGQIWWIWGHRTTGMTAVGLVRHRILFLCHVSLLPCFASSAFFCCLIDFDLLVGFFCFVLGLFFFFCIWLNGIPDTFCSPGWYLVLGSWHLSVCLTPYAAASRQRLLTFNVAEAF